MFKKNNDVNSNRRLNRLVKNMRLREQSDKKKILKKINNEETLTGKCIMAREYLSPQSTDMENLCKKDLGIGKSRNNMSGDGCKNGINYEIKISVHAKESKINFVQIRPDHAIDYYILIAYNMYYNSNVGKGYIFKVPSDEIYNLVVKYGGYAHGTITKQGKITLDSIKGHGYEYALRCNPNKKGKNGELWGELLKYETTYLESNF